MTDISNIIQGYRLYPKESWALLLETLVHETIPLGQPYIQPAFRCVDTLSIQNKTTSDAGIKKWGFSELLHRLIALPKDKNLSIEEFSMKEFAVR